MIRKMKRSAFFALLLAAAVSCKKSGGGEELSPTLPEPKAVEHGTPIGAPVTKSIGPAGGSIQSPDGNITIEIPAGAVVAATNFSIQTVTNELPVGTGPSYRLLPENVAFQKDVKITLQYSDADLIGTTENDLYMAYQDKEGFWHRHIMTGIDKTNKKLYAQTRHFSDWTVERTFYINVDDKTLILGANEELVMLAYWADVKPGTNDKLQWGPVPDANIGGWFVNGPGTFNRTHINAVKYKAPASIPERKEVAVGVRVKNMVSKRNPDRPGNAGLAIVQLEVVLLPEEYFTWYVDGNTYIAYSVDAALVGTNTTLMGTGLAGGVSLFLNGGGAGKYESGNVMEEKKFNCQLSISGGSTPIYYSEYHPCGGTGVKYGSGELNISSYGNIGEYIVGHFVATVYAPGTGCNPKSKKVSGSFRLKRKA